MAASLELRSVSEVFVAHMRCGGQLDAAMRFAGKVFSERYAELLAQAAEVAVSRELFQGILRLIDGLRPRPAPA